MADETATAETTDGAGVDTDREAIDALARAYGIAAAAADLDGFLALYDDDVVVHDLFSPEPIVGSTAWRSQVTDWFGDVKEGDRNVAEIAPLTVHVAGDLATAFGRVRYAIVEPDGSERYGMWNRLTWALRRGDDGAWRVLHEHTSVSLDPKTSAAQFG
jgi:uncharacterized protein (TIGR02246 family)